MVGPVQNYIETPVPSLPPALLLGAGPLWPRTGATVTLHVTLRQTGAPSCKRGAWGRRHCDLPKVAQLSGWRATGMSPAHVCSPLGWHRAPRTDFLYKSVRHPSRDVWPRASYSPSLSCYCVGKMGRTSPLGSSGRSTATRGALLYLTGGKSCPRPRKQATCVTGNSDTL